MTFTKELLPDERLVKILSETQATINEHNRRQVRGSIEVDARLFEGMLAEIQLRRHLMEKAALAEPVAYMYKDKLHADARFSLCTRFGNWSQEDINEYEITEIPLYAAPQPLTTSERAELEDYRNAQQVLLKDHQIRELVNELRDIAVEYHGTQQLRERIARAIRAAMLQVAENAESRCSNSPVIPDGWVACSERMPDVGDVVLTAKDGFVNVGEMERSGANYRYFTSIASGRELPATHWQPLPAAPQQEAE